MNEDERRAAENREPRGAFGTAPDGDDSFGTAPTVPGGPVGTPGTAPNPNPAPRPAPAGGRSAALLIGAGIVVLAILGAIVGFVMR